MPEVNRQPRSPPGGLQELFAFKNMIFAFKTSSSMQRIQKNALKAIQALKNFRFLSFQFFLKRSKKIFKTDCPLRGYLLFSNSNGLKTPLSSNQTPPKWFLITKKWIWKFFMSFIFWLKWLMQFWMCHQKSYQKNFPGGLIAFVWSNTSFRTIEK